MIKTISVIGGLVLVLPVMGCLFRTNEYGDPRIGDEDLTTQLKVMRTQKEVEELLGQPVRVEPIKNGKRWVYRYQWSLVYPNASVWGHQYMLLVELAEDGQIRKVTHRWNQF